jgi:hypothetical protein
LYGLFAVFEDLKFREQIGVLDCPANEEHIGGIVLYDQDARALELGVVRRGE